MAKPKKWRVVMEVIDQPEGQEYYFSEKDIRLQVFPDNTLAGIRVDIITVEEIKDAS